MHKYVCFSRSLTCVLSSLFFTKVGLAEILVLRMFCNIIIKIGLFLVGEGTYFSPQHPSLLDIRRKPYAMHIFW